MSDSCPQPDRLSGPPRRLLRYGFAVLVLGCLPFAFLVYQRLASDARLQEEIEKTDQEDPGWRIADLHARRRPVPDEANSALRVLRLTKSLPMTPGFGMSREKSEEFCQLYLRLQPQGQLQERHRALLHEQLDPVRETLLQARELVSLPTGRYPDPYDATVVATPHFWYLAFFLRDDALLRAQENDPEGALLACHAAVNACRSVGDLPDLWLQEYRVGILIPICRMIERCLAQGQVERPEVLLALQQVLEDEQEQPVLAVALEGYRAYLHQVLEDLEAGRLRRQDVRTHVGSALILPGPAPNLKERLEENYRSAPLKADHVRVLQAMGDLIAVARRPFPQRLELTRSQKKVAKSTYADELLPDLAESRNRQDNSPFFTSQAYLRCTVALLAAERYYLARKELPTALSDLVPEYLPRLPLDPWDGRPLRFRRFEQGIVIYSLGHNGRDDDGQVEESDPMVWPADLGVRLWETKHRRQPPEAEERMPR